MNEDFLHYIWKFQKFRSQHTLTTTDGEEIQILKTGTHNTDNSGPDFSNALICIGEQKWAGNVEIHLKSSDWYAHKHHKNDHYNSVILHVVWIHDKEVTLHKDWKIPTLELQQITPTTTVEQYQNLLQNNTKWINCSGQWDSLSLFKIEHWLERLLIERLNKKANRILNTFQNTNQNWEATAYYSIAQYFGGNKNGDNFLKILQNLPFSFIQKCDSAFPLEALFFGQANLLNDEIVKDAYYQKLKTAYAYLKQKFNLTTLEGVKLEFFRVRPPNFPTIRLSQLANLFSKNPNLFSNINATYHLYHLYHLLSCNTSNYWQQHYDFGKKHKKSLKNTSNSFLDLLIINAIIPLKFAYAKYLNKEIENEIIELYTSITSEKNTIINGFKKEQFVSKNALQSQSLIHLKKEYCDANRCLQCSIGYEILQGK